MADNAVKTGEVVDGVAPTGGTGFNLFGTLADTFQNATQAGSNMIGTISDTLDNLTDAAPQANPFTAVIAPGLPIPGLADATKFLENYIPNPLDMMAGFFDEAGKFVGDMGAKADELIQGGLQTVLKMQTPEGMLDMLSQLPQLQTPEGQEFLEIARNDPELAKALHAAVTQDETVLAGVLSQGKDGEEAFNLGDLNTALKNPNMRGHVTGILNAVAEDPNLDFNYLVKVGKAAKALNSKDAKPEDYKKMQTLLAQAGISDFGLDFMADPMSMLNDFINDPGGFLRDLPTKLNLSPEQAAAFGEILGPLGDMVETVIGGETGYRAFFQHYGPQMTDYLGNLGYRLSGEADADNANREIAADVAANIRNNIANMSGADIDRLIINDRLGIQPSLENVVAGAPVIPSVAAAEQLEGATNNVVFAGPRLSTAYVDANNRPYEDGFPKDDATPQAPSTYQDLRQQAVLGMNSGWN